MAYEKLKTEVYEMLGGINSKASAYANQKIEFRDIVNMNFYVPGALTKRPGTTLYVGATIGNKITGGVEFNRLSGASYIVVSANTNLYTVSTTNFSVINTGLLNNALFEFTTFVDRLFCANGNTFFKYDGSNIYPYSLPEPPSNTAASAAGGSLVPGVTSSFNVTYGYVNERGYFGPSPEGVTVIISGTAGGNSITYSGLTTPSGFGITAIALYRSSPGGIDPAFTTFCPVGTTTITDPGWPITSQLTNPTMYFTLAPRFMEIYNNQLFMCGFSSAPSTVYWSQIGEPEGVEPDFFAEFRTNDGDRMSGMKVFSGSLMAMKQKSIHRVTGDNPNNFSLQEVSDQYGCVSDRSIVQFEDYLMWVDRPGIVKYDGANIGIISNKIEPVFSTMNYDAAIDKAVAIHWRKYNEVWFHIPCNGATFNNTTVVYDYFADAWTKYEGVNISTLFLAQGANAQPTPFAGGYTGNLFYYGTSLMRDHANSDGMTCGFKTAFHSPLGQTNESQFRQFYLNVNPVLGFTNNITVNLIGDFGNGQTVTRQMGQTPFQNRIDFGIPARSLQAEVWQTSATLPFTVTGYAIASRFQRNT